MEKISKTAINMYNSAMRATGKLAREIKLKAHMAENKRKVQEIYEDIGKTIYEKYLLKEEINAESDLLNPCSRIDLLADEIENLRMELLKLKDLKQCPECHYEIYYDFHYCPNCGYIQEDNASTTKNDGPATLVTTDGDDKIMKEAMNIETDDENSDDE